MDMQDEEAMFSPCPEDSYSLESEEDCIGIGAAMSQDVAGLDFLDRFRPCPHELHREFPMNRVGVDVPEMGMGT
jgi:hypothetical protein